MKQEEAERRAADQWLAISSESHGFALRLEPSLSEAYAWGWVVYFGPAQRQSWKPGRPRFEGYAVADQRDAYPVGSKGLDWSLKQLGVFDVLDGLKASERNERYDRLMTVLNQPPERSWDDALDYLATTFPEIAAGERAVLRVTRDGGARFGLGGWVFYDTTDSSLNVDACEKSLVAMSKADLLARDPSLREVIDLPVGWQATRPSACLPWLRERFAATEPGRA